MNYLKVTQVVARTGLTERAVYLALADGSLVAHGGGRSRVPEEAVDRFIIDRQLAAAARVGDLTRFAEKVRQRLQQPGGIRGAHATIDQDALKIFGPHVLKAVTLAGNPGCRWCWARLTALVYGGIQPQLTDAHQILLGEPCDQDVAAMHSTTAKHHEIESLRAAL